MDKKKEIFLLIFLVCLFLIINYNFIDSKLEEFLEESDYRVVQRVIDGDTLVINNQSIRLLGINSPEKGEKYYNEAREFLSDLVLDKKLKVEIEGKDKYYRELAYLLDGTRNINIELVRNGFANVYILDNKKYESELRDAWEECIKDNINLCEKSEDKCKSCIELRKMDYKNQEVIFYNKCDFNCDLTGWSIKDEGRKKFTFENFILEGKREVKITADDFNKDYVWTPTGDTLFLKDKEGKLVLWENY